MSADLATLLARIAMLLASRTNLTPIVTAGIERGPGNQGSSAYHLLGQAGTGADKLSLPRTLHFGTSSGGIV
jgi:hypothetical protein